MSQICRRSFLIVVGNRFCKSIKVIKTEKRNYVPWFKKKRATTCHCVILVLEMGIVPGLLTYLLVILKRFHWYHPPDFFFEVSEVKDYLI